MRYNPTRYWLFVIALTLSLMTSPVKANDFSTGLLAYKARDFEKTVMIWRPLAEQGHAEAQYNLGTLYDTGIGVSQDDGKAAKWYRLAAEQGSVKAQFNLGILYHNGRGVSQDYLRAHMWFNIARRNGTSVSSDMMQSLERRIGGNIAQAQQMARRCVDSGYQDC